MIIDIQHLIWNELPEVTSFTHKLPEVLGSQDLPEAFISAPNSCSPPPEWISWVNEWSHALLRSPGIAIVQANPDVSDEQLRRQYAVISRALGILNDRYGYFFDVKDQGLDYTKSPVPVSKTNAETSFHTDSTAKVYFPDVVGLLCIHPAATGGDSLVTNAAGAYHHLLAHHPLALNALSQPLYRDVITPGSTYDLEAIRNNAFPIFSSDSNGSLFRYMRYWVERAYEKLELPLAQEITDGMNAVDAHFHQPENQIQFRMERGAMLFVNNRFLCHNRTAFSSSNPPRTLVRTWINWSS